MWECENENENVMWECDVRMRMLMMEWLLTLIWHMMVLFTYLHEVMQAKLLWWFFYQQDFLSFPDLEKVCENPLTNKPRPDLINKRNKHQQRLKFFSSLHNLHLFQVLHARQGHLWTLMPKVKLAIKQKMSGFELRLSFHEFLIFWFDWVSTFCHLHFTGPILTVD